MDDSSTVPEILEDRPDLESALDTVLTVDDEKDGWTFDEVPVDSGVFGELVSRGIVERTDDGDTYRVTDPAVVRAALEDEETVRDTADAESSGRPTLDGEAILERVAAVDGSVAWVLGAILVVVLARAYVYPSVFRGGTVVLSGNDPYYYRYWVEQALAASAGRLDLSALATVSDTVRTGEPLLVATLWFFASLLGGDPATAGRVLAFYPVVAGAITAILVYLLARQVTDDRRVALAAVILLAVTPAHAFRTSLGFADHHAFDYVWLMLTVYGIVRLDAWTTADWRKPRQVVWIAVTGIAIAGQTLAWNGGPLLLVPFGIYVALRVLDDVRSDVSPASAHLPLVGGVGVGALIAAVGHVQVGWHSGAVAFTPAMLLLGTIGAVFAGELAQRYSAGVSVLAAVECVGAVAGIALLRVLLPGYWTEIEGGIIRIVASRGVAETQSLLSGDTLGWLLLFGLVLVVAVPVLVWTSIEAYRGERRMLVPAVYCWYFLGLAMYQVRFAGQLAMFASVFAGVGFVFLAAAVDLTEKPVPVSDGLGERPTVSTPDWRSVGQYVVLFVLIGGLSLVQVPVKVGQVTTDDGAYRTATWMDRYAAEENWEYPENYVFSQWGDNRMYNYYVSGQSRYYGFAQENYRPFLASDRPDDWYTTLAGRAGFVVVRSGHQFPDQTLYSGLMSQMSGGSAGRDLPGLTHYRAVHSADGGSRYVFTLVDGGVVTGTASSNESITVSTEVDLGGHTFTYRRTVQTTMDGRYAVTVPYPGTYTTTEADSQSISEPVVRNGGFAGKSTGEARWQFEEGRGDVVFDSRGNSHGFLSGGTWTRGVRGRAISLESPGEITVPEAPPPNASAGWTASLWFRTTSNQSLVFGNVPIEGGGFGPSPGVQVAVSKYGRLLASVGSRQTGTNVYGPTVTDGEWHHAAVVVNETAATVYLDGAQVDDVRIDGAIEPRTKYEFGAFGFAGAIDDARVLSRSLSASDIRQRYNRSCPAQC